MSPLLFRLLVLLAGISVAPGGAPSAGPADGFPHERHARLFPVCDGCHAGIIEAGASSFPDAASCARCHDGTRKPRVSWTAPTRRVTNLRFAHPAHQRAASLAHRPADCTSCHRLEGGGRMAVTASRPEACFACHANAEHLDATGGCQVCHAALAEVDGWDSTRVASLPRPAAHRATAFLRTHGTAAAAPEASCATCHARESCQRCHLNGDRLPAIAALAPDSRIASLTRGLTPRYDAPASHGRGWEWQHGSAAAAGAASCANCHARPSCSACHLSDNQATSTLPDASASAAPGVRFATARRVHANGFARSHQAAGAGDAGCLGCHERRTCDQCHATLRNSGFHEPNFLEQHGPAAYASDVQCSSCHSSERFCRGCHAGTGRAGEGRNNVAFHTATPLWLLGHGQAARQSLEGCASCHAQADCTRCHSALTGWRVNPHGSGFNADRLVGANRLTCLRCHRAAELVRQ
jgi:hypothetical protein